MSEADDEPPERKRRLRRRRIPVKSLTRNVIAAGWVEIGGKPRAGSLPTRPKTWGECVHDRPCPWVSCRFHLYLDVDPETGSITINHPDLEPWELPHTCALDVAAYGGRTLEEVGEILARTRERMRQVEIGALIKLGQGLAGDPRD